MSSTGYPFSYIVVGAGTAGPVVARRLADADPTAHVLLIEAGPSHDGIINSQMAMGWQNIHGTDLDWGYDTTPQPYANNRVIHIPRGKFIGGCSAINGMLIVRGTKADYDRWADAGCPGWAWDDVLPYFKKFETFHPTAFTDSPTTSIRTVPAPAVPRESSLADPASSSSLTLAALPTTAFHGTTGPVHTTVHPLAPISRGLLENYVEKGFEYKPDMFVEGEGEGVGHATRTVYNGVRTTAADFLSPAALPPNFTVLTSTTVLRVILSRAVRGAQPRAVGVEVETEVPVQPSQQANIHATVTRQKRILRAQREVILCAGAYNSPALLMHSGIGPHEHLKEVGIECVANLKGVGANLQDHLIVFNFYELNKPHLSHDRFVYPPGAAEVAFREWMETRTGIMSRFPFGAFAFKRMNEIMKNTNEWKAAQANTGLEDPTGQHPTQPHIEYFNSELYGGGPQFTDHPSLPSDSAFAMITMLCGPQSRGTVRLRSSDPHAPPLIDHAYLSSPLDVALLAEGAQLAHEIACQGLATREHIVGPWPRGAMLPQDKQGWKDYVRARAGTCYHPGGTCKMGSKADDWAVVDEKLRVRGVLGLRVADCSIMPWINNGHTQAPAYMIGEKCADLILEDHTASQQFKATPFYTNTNTNTSGTRARNQG